MPQLTDLRELKVWLDIDPANTSEDKKLNFYIELATQWIEEILDRPGLFFASRTEYYKGTNTQKLLLNSRPVYTTPTIQVNEDEAGYYGAPTGSFASTTALTYGDDFCLQIDQANGTSRSGILIRRNDVWPRPTNRMRGLLAPFIGEDFGSIKITYSGGYTVDDLPSQFRAATTLLVANLRQLLPLGQPIQAESYEERAISYGGPQFAGSSNVSGAQKTFLLALAKPLIMSYKNWRF